MNFIKNLALVILLGVATNLCLSYLITDSWTWKYSIQTLWHRFWKKNPSFRNFTLTELSIYNGTDDSLPIYISINGSVFDVTFKSRLYAKDGPYNFFSGKDATRAFLTGCFIPSHATHDIRGLNESALSYLPRWIKFYENHPDYIFLGKVILASIHPDDPIPPDCQGSLKQGHLFI